jgi:ribosome-associated heat shock protein Hsp15
VDPSASNVPATIRIDKWLWAVRLFKTRTLAAAACRGGHVKIEGSAVKPSKEVAPGEIIAVRAGEINRTVKVLAPIEKRVGPKLVKEAMEDLTPAHEYLRAMQIKASASVPKRPKGAGRPTKKERRAMEQFTPENL